MELKQIHASAAPATIDAAAADSDKAPSVTSNSYNGGLIAVRGYKHRVAVDLDGISNLGQPHPLYRNHSEEKILGSGVTVREGNTLQTTGELTNEGEHVEEVVRLGKSNYPFQASVGMQPTKLQELRKGQTAEVNGQTISGPAYVARESYLMEVSVVSSGADRTTSTQIAAEHADPQENIDMEFEQFVASSGFDSENLSDKQEATLRAAYSASGSSESSPSSVDAVIQAAKQREDLHRDYGRIIASAVDRGMDSDTAEKLVEAAKSDGLSATEFELQVLRASRHQGSTSVPVRGNGSADVIEAALGMAVGLEEEDFAPEALEAAHREFKNGIGLSDVLQIAAKQNGYRDVSSRDTRALLQAAFAPVQANSSTYDVAGILSNIANKSARRGYMAVEQEWRKIASIRPVSDLKEHKAYSLTGDMSFKPVGAGGELKHAELGEEEYSNSADTYGRMFAITRRDIINDDLNAFTQVRQMLGRGAALALNRIVWTEWLDNAATFWSAGRNNFISGAATALDIDSLSQAVTTFEEQVDPDGNPLGLMPAVLVVPSALKVQGMRITNDSDIRIDGSSAKTQYFTKNPWAGQFSLCSSQYLNNANIPGGSATHWWLAASPEDTPSLEVVFLNGRQVPAIEQANADFNTLGIQMRGYFDFGAAKQNHRASVMSAGQ
ncbi:MAG TPA: hypothetical protein DDW52_10190 [Planctomycetaceae bacterium]|nr:hypothetical protein [Planctomycetaceae bacterium]